MRIALVSCVKSKHSSASRASDLYSSALFAGMRCYAEIHADAWFILSAEYGLLSPDQIIEPYDRTLNKMSKLERAKWSDRVGREVLAAIEPGVTLIILAGKRYREGIVPLLKEHGYTTEIPMAGLKFGQQLSWLKKQK